MENPAGEPDRPMSTDTVNQENAKFWKKEAALTQQRLSDPALYQLAVREMKRQAIRVPVYYQKSLEALLEEAHEARSTFMSFNGRNGGKRKNALQKLIERILEKEPKIDCNRLLHRLKADKSFGAVLDVTDGIISFESATGEIADVKVSALKHRLSRAKKKNRESR
jgi:hypothetical protein